MSVRFQNGDVSSAKTPPKEFLHDLGEVLVPLHRFALALCRQSHLADDLTQATCERALSRWSQFQIGTRMDSWAFSIMHSIWKNQLRKSHNRQNAYKKVSETNLHHDGEKDVLGKIALSEVLSALNSLNEEQRVAITLVCINGLSYRDAAKVLDVPQGTLESRIGRGRIELGRLLSFEEQDGVRVVSISKGKTLLKRTRIK